MHRSKRTDRCQERERERERDKALSNGSKMAAAGHGATNHGRKREIRRGNGGIAPVSLRPAVDAKLFDHLSSGPACVPSPEHLQTTAKSIIYYPGHSQRSSAVSSAVKGICSRARSPQEDSATHLSWTVFHKAGSATTRKHINNCYRGTNVAAANTVNPYPG